MSTDGARGPAEQIAAADAVLAELGGSTELSARRRCAGALLDKAWGLSRQGDWNDALDCLEQLRAQAGDVADRDLSVSVERGERMRAHILVRVERYCEAEAVLDDLLSRLDGAVDEDRRVVWARAMTTRVWLLRRVGRDEDALAASERLLAVFGEDPPPGRVDLVVTARAVLGLLLDKLGRTDEAMEILPQIVERYAADPDARVSLAVTRAMFDYAQLLQRLGRPESALGVYRELVDRYGDRTEAELVSQVGGALDRMAWRLGEDRQHAEVLAISDEILRRFEERPPDGLPWIVFDARYRRAVALSKLGRLSEAAAACDLFLAQARENGEGHAQAWLANALVVRRNIAERLGHTTDMLAAEDELRDRADSQAHRELRIGAAEILADRIWRVTRTGQFDAAYLYSNELMMRCAREQDPAALEEIVRDVIRAANIFAQTARTGPSRAGTAPARPFPLITAPPAVGGVLRLARLARPTIRRQLRHAQALYELVIARCQDPGNPRLLSAAVVARERRAWVRMELGHVTAPIRHLRWLLGTGQPGLDALDIELTRLQRPPINSVSLAGAMMTKALLLAQADREQDALDLMGQVATRFAQDPARQARRAARAARCYRKSRKHRRDPPPKF